MKKIKSLYIIGVLASVVVGILVWYVVASDTSNTQSINPVNTPKSQQQNEYKIVAFGDSLTAGFGLDTKDSYPMQLQNKIADSRVRVINAGVSGETTFGNLERAAFIKSQNPDMVILGIGGNDALRGLDIANTKENIQNTIDILKSGDTPPQIVLLQIQAPLNLGLAYKRKFDQLYVDLSKKNNIPLTPFVVNEVFLNTAYMLGDGIHPNKDGYAFLVDTYVYPVVKKYIPKN